MELETQEIKKTFADILTSTLIQFSIIALTVLVCVWAFWPFLPIMLWSLVLAIALYPVYLPLKKKMGGSSGRSATLLVIVSLLLIGVPTVIMGGAFATQLLELVEALSEGRIAVPKPNIGVSELPFVGDDLYKAWVAAATDLPDFLEKLGPRLTPIGKWLAGLAAGTAGGVFRLLGAVIVAGIMLAWADEASKSVGHIFRRFAGEKRGLKLQKLTTNTIRSVAIGIIGIAFITAFLFGVTLFLAGVPAAGVLAVVALIFGILQVPVTLVALVGVAFLWMGENSTLHNISFTVLILASSLVDNVLKPMILGRGLAVPMPVVLIGALGGMMSGGILGMFIGAAFLAAGYQVFMEWVYEEASE